VNRPPARHHPAPSRKVHVIAFPGKKNEMSRAQQAETKRNPQSRTSLILWKFNLSVDFKNECEKTFAEPKMRNAFS
jgi:hypothetical protein